MDYLTEREAAVPGLRVGTAAEAILQARGLRKTFGQTPALGGCNLEITRGEIVAITGPSGSGKSTLLHCLAGIMLPDSGEVLVQGRSLTAMTDTERAALRRTTFGFVFQFGQLVPELSVLENVALPLLLNGVRRREALAAALTWVEAFDVQDLVRRRLGEISGGQAQRVAVARAMAIEPRVIFADEPTGSLDSVSGALVLDALVQAVRERDVTVVVVTHDRDVASYADREIVVRDGLIASEPLASTRVEMGA